MSLLGMVRGLVDAQVRFVVVGGVAGAAHGSSHVTDDLDVCYDTTRDNLERLAEVLARWKAYPRGIEPGLPFIMDRQTLHGAEILTLTTREGEIDVLKRVAGVGDYRKCLAASEPVNVEGVSFRVLGLEALIDSKRAAGRKRDLEHLRELEALQELKRRPKGSRPRSAG